MNKFLITLLMVFVFSITTNAQLQQSGGAGGNGGASSITQGGNTAIVTAAGALSSNISQIAGSAISLGAKTSANSFPVTIASDQATFPVTIGSTGTVGINAGTNLIGSIVPKTTCGTTFVDSLILQNIPTSSTLIPNMSTATCVKKVFFSNTTAGALSVNLLDNTGTPVPYVSAFSIPANSNMILDFDGMKFNLGVRWFASATGITAQAIGYQ